MSVGLVWRAKCEEFLTKCGISKVSDAGAQQQLAENGSRVGLNMESKMHGIPQKKMIYFRSQWVWSTTTTRRKWT